MLNLDFTKVTAPISGRIGKRLLDAGNLIQAHVTALASLVVLNPICVSFDIKEKTVRRLLKAKAEGKARWATHPTAAIGFINSEDAFDLPDYKLHGKVDFIAAAVNLKEDGEHILKQPMQTIRAVTANPGGLLKPGMEVAVRLTTDEPHKARLVSGCVLPSYLVYRGRGKGQLLVVNDKNEVEERNVVVGLRHGNRVEVKDGLRPGEWVVVTSPERLQQGRTVKPKRVAMPDQKE